MTQLQVETQGARVRSFVNLREFARTSSSPHVVVTGDAGIGANGRRLMPATQDTVQIGSINPSCTASYTQVPCPEGSPK